MAPSPFPTEEDDEDEAGGGGGSKATVMFDFTASSEFEISLTSEFCFFSFSFSLPFPLLSFREPTLLSSSLPFYYTFSTAGESVTILEEDDGSGWLKVLDSQGGKGLCPVTYVKVSEPSLASSSSIRGSATSIPTRAAMIAPMSASVPVSQGSGKFGTFPRDATSSSFLSLSLSSLSV